MKPIETADVAVMLGFSEKVIVVPGYGMAVAQAQHKVWELCQALIARGVAVKFAIHPVAGRMPGHMNVLLAEAGVPYDLIYDEGEINAEFETADVALVIGANDVVNPVARTDKSSPIYGMPILNADKAKNVIVIKRGQGAGFSGIENALFYLDHARMLYGDGQAKAAELVQAIKDSLARQRSAAAVSALPPIAQHLPLLRRELAESLSQLHAPLGRHHAIAAIDVDEPRALAGRQAAKLLIALRARPRVARHSCRAKARSVPARACDRAGSSRANARRRARSAAGAAASSSSSFARAEPAAAAAPRSSSPTRCLARRAAPASNANNAMHVATSLFAFIVVIPHLSGSDPSRDPRRARRQRCPSPTPRSRATRRPPRPRRRDTRENPRSGPGSAARRPAPLRAREPQQPSAEQRGTEPAHQPTLSPAAG